MVGDIQNIAMVAIAAVFLSAPSLFAQTNDNSAAGTSETVSGEALEKYPSPDFRNSLTGLFTGLVVTERAGYSGTVYNSDNSDKIDVQGRGFQNVKYMVNGMPAFISMYQIDPEEVESVTYVKNPLDKARFGPDGTTGLVNIVLKQGKSGPLRIKVSTEGGVNIVDRFPEWCNGYEYATLNNEARRASGFPSAFSSTALEGFKANNPEDYNYPSVDYRSLMLNKVKSYNKTTLSIMSGNDALRYNVHLGYVNEGDIMAIGTKASSDRFNIGTNLKASITPKLSIDALFRSSVQLLRSPIFGSGTSSKHVINDVIRTINVIPPTQMPIHAILADGSEASENDRINQYYCITDAYPDNPYADLSERGSFTEKGILATVSSAINWSIVKGLTAVTWVGLDSYFLTRRGQNPDYVAYYWDGPSEDSYFISPTHKGASVSNYSSYNETYYQNLNAYEKLSYSLEKGDHSFNAFSKFRIQSISRTAKETYERQVNWINSASYAYKGKYILDVVGNYSGSMSLPRGHKFEFLPSVGATWVVSNEGFLKNSRISYLKVYGQYATLAYENYMSPYYVDDVYSKSAGVKMGPSGLSPQWFGSTTEETEAATLYRYGNGLLRYEKRKEMTVGASMKLLKNRLGIDVAYFSITRDGIVNDATSVIPGVYGLTGVSYFANYNVTRYRGWELNLSWQDTHGDFTYRIAASAMTNTGKFVKVNEADNLPNLLLQGKHVGDEIAFVYDGRYSSWEEINNGPKNTLYSNVAPGDLKYAEVVQDGILDYNDRQVIGNTSPKLVYALNLYLKYRNVDFTLVGTGRAFVDVFLTNEYFWNGWGDGNYSAFVRDNHNGDLSPALSYVRNTNNYQVSAFWMRDGSFFKIQNVEVGYYIRFKKKNLLKGSRVYLRGANLLTLSGIKDVDPEALSSGVTTSPLFRTVTAGIQLNF